MFATHSCALGISISLTAVVLIQERKEGLMDRTWVAGVNVTEIIISQVLTQFFILLVQIILMLIFVLWVFKVWQQLSNCRAENLICISSKGNHTDQWGLHFLFGT